MRSTASSGEMLFSLLLLLLLLFLIFWAFLRFSLCFFLAWDIVFFRSWAFPWREIEFFGGSTEEERKAFVLE
ncbi:hypothetical protein QBC38DRAFT_468569 [Podospora fimiseda]|uniref:Uncharacterized protein n=1 Tax=Podospora fimiseda TaxID=252190 RepID=A0AAN7BW92_9PEZI|nr:hypothetical protein QBC38DRAFT_468569 [Podospora fimiseda]